MDDVDSCRELEQLACEMRQAAGARRRKVELAGLCLGELNQFAHAFGWNRGGDDKHLGYGRDQRHRREILCRIVGDLFHARADHERARADDADRRAVGSGFCDDVGSQHAALAGPVVDHDRLARDLGHALPDHAGDDVVGPAGRERHDQPDRLFGEIIGCSQGGKQQQR
jgi:hypothetical protein